MPALTLKIFLTPFFLQDNIPLKNNNSGKAFFIKGFNQYQLHLQPSKMSWICNKNLIRDCNKDRPGKLASVQSENNCILNALMS